jgi:hypothetical protein
MEDNKLISKVNSFGIYQISLTVIISLLNYSVYFPSYFITYLGSPPYVDYLSENTTITSILDKEICLIDYTINKNLTKTNFLLENLDFSLFNLPYCKESMMTLMYVLSNLNGYMCLITNLLFRPRTNFIITFFLYFLGLICISVTYYVNDNSLENFIPNNLFIMIILQIFAASMLTSSLHFISGVTCIFYRQRLIYFITILPSTASLITTTFLYNNNIAHETFFLIINIFPAICIILGTIYSTISMENPKYYSNNDLDFIRNTLTHICKINYCHRKEEYLKKIESFDLNDNEILEIHPRKQFSVNSSLLKSKIIITYMLLYLILGFISQVNKLCITDFSKDIDIYCYLIMYLNFILFVFAFCLIKNCEMFIYPTIIFIGLTFVNIFLVNNPYLQISQTLIFEYTIGNIFANSLTFFFRVIDKKRRIVNTILMLCFYHGCTSAPVCYFYFHRTVSKIFITFLGFVLLLLQLLLNGEYKERLN